MQLQWVELLTAVADRKKQSLSAAVSKHLQFLLLGSYLWLKLAEILHTISFAVGNPETKLLKLHILLEPLSLCAHFAARHILRVNSTLRAWLFAVRPPQPPIASVEALTLAKQADEGKLGNPTGMNLPSSYRSPDPLVPQVLKASARPRIPDHAHAAVTLTQVLQCLKIEGKRLYRFLGTQVPLWVLPL